MNLHEDPMRKFLNEQNVLKLKLHYDVSYLKLLLQQISKFQLDLNVMIAVLVNDHEWECL